MKIRLSCPDCQKEFWDDVRTGVRPTQGHVPRDEFWFSVAEIQEDSRYESRCPKGHIVVTTLRNLKFEILYEIGANAILDGYYREAVSSFQASLERMYEFFLTVVCKQKGVPDDNFGKAWGEVSKQSERQLGAFIFLHSAEFLSPPQLLSNKMIQFRNNVTHQGLIPSRAVAVQFGQSVLDVMRPVLIRARERYAAEIEQLTWRKLNYEAVQLTLGSIFRRLSVLDFTVTSLDEYLNKLTNDRAVMANLDKLPA